MSLDALLPTPALPLPLPWLPLPAALLKPVRPLAAEEPVLALVKLVGKVTLPAVLEAVERPPRDNMDCWEERAGHAELNDAITCSKMAGRASWSSGTRSEGSGSGTVGSCMAGKAPWKVPR